MIITFAGFEVQSSGEKGDVAMVLLLERQRIRMVLSHKAAKSLHRVLELAMGERGRWAFVQDQYGEITKADNFDGLVEL